MKVYVVACVDYENYETIGIFSTNERALDAIRIKEGDINLDKPPDGIIIEEYDIDVIKEQHDRPY